MARALTLQRIVVPAAERGRFAERLRARRAHYRAARCNYWVFEDEAAAGTFVEFIEAADAETLATATASAPDRVSEARVYREVELP